MIEERPVTAVTTLQAVLFDFGGVIVDSPFASFAEIETGAGLPVGFIRTVNSRNPDTNAWSRIERGEIDVDVFCRMFADEAADLGHQVDSRAVIEALLGMTGAVHRAVPQMLNAVRSCRERGLRVGLITNNVVPMSRDGDAAWVFDTFDAVVESCVAGVRKPEPAIYLKALGLLDADATRTVMLDDLGINLKPARALGLYTIKVLDPVEAAAAVLTLLDSIG